MLKFQAEAFFFHLVVAFRIKLVEKCYFLIRHGQRFVKLSQNTEFQHLVAEVAAIELYAEDGLIEVLQLGHRKLLWQQFKTDWLEVNLTAQLIGGLTQNQIMVKCQRWNFVEREPLLSSGNHWALAASSPAFTSLRRTKAK